MTAARFAADITVLSGTFASQPMAFARLIDAVDRAGGFVDLATVDVIRHARETRLAHYFPPATVALIDDLREDDDTLILLKPDETGRPWSVPIRDEMLKHLGVFAGEVVKPATKGDWA